MWNMWQEEPPNSRLLFRRQLGEMTTVVEKPKTTPPNNIPIPQQGQYVNESSQIIQTSIPQPGNWPNRLSTPSPNDGSIPRTNPVKKLVLPHLQFGETIEPDISQYQRPQTSTITKNTMSAVNNHLSTGSEDGKFTSSTNTTVKLRTKKDYP